jgi:protein SCO1/2
VIAPRRSARALAALALGAALAPAPALAQFWTREAPSGPATDQTPAALEDVRVDERLGNPVPLDVELVDWTGAPWTFGEAFDGKKPVVLALVYYDCPMLCGLILSGTAKAMRENGLELGRDYEAVTVSFDPGERPAQAAERRRGYLQSLGRDDGGRLWPFTVASEASARRLADAVGFHYAWDEATREWAHMAAIFVLTPDGEVSRYLYGIEYPPKDFRLAVVEAAAGKVGTSFDRFLLSCYRYDPASRKYEPYAWGIVRAGAAAVMVALFGLIAGLVWRERRNRARHAA